MLGWNATSVHVAVTHVINQQRFSNLALQNIQVSRTLVGSKPDILAARP